MGWDYKAKLVYGKLLTEPDEAKLLKLDPDADGIDEILEGIFSNNYKEGIYAWFCVYSDETFYVITTKEYILSAEFGPEEVKIPEIKEELSSKIDENWKKLGLDTRESKWYLGVHVW